MFTLLLVAGALAGLSAPAAEAKLCKRVRNVLPTGIANRDAIQIRATNTSCRVARGLPRRVIRYFRYGGLGSNTKATYGLSAWDCQPRWKDEALEAREGDPVICLSGDRRVTWRLSP